MKLRFDWFLTGMGIAVLLAWLFPDPGAKGGWLHPEILTKAGVALIFFLHGATLSFESLRAGAMLWRLHVVVQVCTFVLFPVLGLAFLWCFDGRIDPDMKVGIFYLCALPSTVSSSVALSGLAKGNVAAAVFNATLSSVIGVVITPLWIGLLLKSGGKPLPMGQVMLDLVIWLILPLIAGQLSRPWIGGFMKRHKPIVSKADRVTVLILVYTSFCDSVKWGVWSNQGFRTVGLTALGSVLLFFVVFAAVGLVCDVLKFNREDRIAAVLCGSKKTLASGVPMAQLIFGANPGLSLILLPIMIYHPLQLIICGAIAGHWAPTAPAETPPPA